jgi:hypothetical protein
MTRICRNPAGIRPMPYRKTIPGQSMFVDDPRSSLELAAGLVDDSLEALVMSVTEQQHSLLSAWQGDYAGTEERRTTLWQYHAFWNRLEDFSRET